MLACTFNTVRPVMRLRDDLDRLFDQFWGGPSDLAPRAFAVKTPWMPSIDVSENDTEITMRAEVPGVEPKDIDVTVSGQVLTISGEKQESAESKDEGVYHSERRFGSFRRSIQLPTSVDTNNITAAHKNGVLLIRLHKRSSVIPKQIPVEAAGK